MSGFEPVVAARAMRVRMPAFVQRRASALPSRLLNWITCWILLPNLAFCAIWAVGGPPRYPEIIATATIGLIVRKLRFAARYAAFAAALAFSALSFISTLFKLSLVSLVASLEFLAEMRPAASVEYVALALLLVATLATAWRLLKRPGDFEGPLHLVCAIILLFAFAGLDKALSFGTRGSLTGTAPAGAPFASAVSESGFGAPGRDTNLLIVMVEALGVPSDPALRDRMLARWRRSDIGRLYAVEMGSAPFYGSTTSGEVRELCGRWGDYPELSEAYDPRCLPARLAARDYRTTAVHSFDGGFFDRTTWYPHAGFQSLLFREELVARGAAKCPGVFPGACDRDVPPIIATQLKRIDGRQFVYWLTVNTHLPVPVDAALRTDHCARFDKALAESHAMACRLFSLWGELDAGLARMLTDPYLPPTDVLIVGDHAPPFLDRRQRAMFDPARVPWIMLRHRKGADRE